MASDLVVQEKVEKVRFESSIADTRLMMVALSALLAGDAEALVEGDHHGVWQSGNVGALYRRGHPVVVGNLLRQ